MKLLNDDEKRKHRNYLTYRGTARSFIRKHAMADDLKELKQLISEREKIYSDGVKSGPVG